ncbi:MAG: deoxyribose-phosphate aldolase, partial [Pannonibacter indicus]
IVAVREVCGSAHLKVIFETGELQTYDNVRRASWLAMMAGGHFIKTSTGKVKVNATLEAAEIMLTVIDEVRTEQPGRQVGFKPAGGIRTLDEAAAYLALADRILGPNWVSSATFRFGASGLLDALIDVIKGGAGSAREGY